MNKEEVEKLFKAFTFIFLGELLHTLEEINKNEYENKMVGEIFEAYLKTAIAGLSFLQKMPTKGKTTFIEAAKKLAEGL